MVSITVVCQDLAIEDCLNGFCSHDIREAEAECEMALINNKDEKVFEIVVTSKQDLAKTMQLTHAYTYHCRQARAIMGDLRLHRHFKL